MKRHVEDSFYPIDSVKAAVEKLAVIIDHVLCRKKDKELFGRAKSAFPENKRCQNDEPKLGRNDYEILP